MIRKERYLDGLINQLITGGAPSCVGKAHTYIYVCVYITYNMNTWGTYGNTYLYTYYFNGETWP